MEKLQITASGCQIGEYKNVNVYNKGWKEMDDKLKNQMKNRDDAVNAAKDFIDCFFDATPEYKNQIGKDVIALLVVKSQIDDEANQFLNRIIEMRNFLNSLGIK